MVSPLPTHLTPLPNVSELESSKEKMKFSICMYLSD